MADRITTERLAELRAIAEKATPGPWRWGEHVDPTVALKEMLEAGAPLTVATLPNTGAKPGSCLFICLLLGQREEVDFDNAALIAAAPELLSALLAAEAEVERLGKVVSFATVDMWIEGDDIMMQVGDGAEPFLYEHCSVMPELAAELKRREGEQ